MRARHLSLLLVVLFPASLSAAIDPTYTAVREDRLDGRSIALVDTTFDRDAYHFKLNGSLNLLAPVSGVTVGAVFIGTGEYTLTPATDDERHQLALEVGDDKLTTLSDSFTSAVFFDQALIKAAGEAKPGPINGEATKVFDDFLKRERKDFTTNFHIRLLLEMLDPQPEPLFLAFIHGKKVPPAILAVDRAVPMRFACSTSVTTARTCCCS